MRTKGTEETESCLSDQHQREDRFPVYRGNKLLIFGGKGKIMAADFVAILKGKGKVGKVYNIDAQEPYRKD